MHRVAQLTRDVSEWQPERKCLVCLTTRPLVLFPKTPRLGAYSKICQLCSTEQLLKDEAMQRSICFRRARKLVPLREKRGR